MWYKNDLRVADHPALAAAAASPAGVAAAFVLDPAGHVRTLRLGELARLWERVAALKRALRARGGDLRVEFGAAEAVLPDLAAELGPGAAVFASREVDFRWRARLAAASARLDAAGVPLVTDWEKGLYDTFDSPNFAEARRRPVAVPLAAPARLPRPKAAQAKKRKKKKEKGGGGAAAWAWAGEMPTKRAWLDFCKAHGAREDETGPSVVPWKAVDPVAAGPGEADALIRGFLEGAGRGAAPMGGPVRGERLLAAAEGLDVPGAPGQAFPVLFKEALAQGAVTPNQVFYEARKVQALNFSLLEEVFPAPAKRPVLAAVDAALAHGFTRHLALEDDRPLLEAAGVSAAFLADPDVEIASRWWEWEGQQCEFVEAGPRGEGAPAKTVVLVHGFGAFGAQWRGVVELLVREGFRVYAPTMPGYGRSEKQGVLYSPDLWAGFVRDFLLEVVGEPATLVGNSIGGFMCANTAAEEPELVEGLVLVNSAGPIEEDFDLAAYRAQPPRPPAPRLVVEALSRGLFLYLQTSVPKTLKWLYPSRPAWADEFMQREIVRASADPGALKVFQSAFYLKPPPPLNYVVDKYGGPTLVLQGADDPLNDAAGRARDLERLCTRARATLLRGGHVSTCIRPRREGAHRTDNRQSARTTRTQRSSPPSWSPSSSPRPRNRSRWRWRARRREGERYGTCHKTR